jgi:CheY-like chemotaxis protein
MEHSTLVDCSILLVGHKPHTVPGLQRIFEDAGASICVATTSDDALSLIEIAAPSAALLDYTQSIGDSHRIAEQLTRLGIPFVFCKDIGRNEAWPQAEVLSRPFSGADLIEMLRQCLRLEVGGDPRQDEAKGMSPYA